MKLTVGTFVTLDGVMQAPGGPEEDRSDGFEHGGWPYFTGDDLIAAKFNSVRKYVASRTLERVDWNNSTLIKGYVVEGIKKLKREPGNELQVHGSGELIQTLLKHDLVDAFRLWTFPVLLGRGKRLFANGTVPARLKLVETQTSSTGVVLHVLESAGRLEDGSFALEHPTEAEIERRQKIEAGG